jgi:hypothetical protein
MCYTAGPRCSPHAAKFLLDARKTGDPQEIAEAQQDFNLSPAGIKAVRDSGNVTLADELQEKRSEMIKKSKEISETNVIIRQQMQEFEGDPYHALTLKYIKSYTKKYGVAQVGRTRAVFDRGDGYMIKVPLNGEGFMANRSERLTSESDDTFIPIAKCWEEDDKSIPGAGISVLVMEKVTPIGRISYKDLPNWVGFVDCAQVGHDKSGNLVAYDL